MCKKLLGDVKNTSFTIFDAQGDKQLVKASRSPRATFGKQRVNAEVSKVIQQTGAKGTDGKAVLQDFHSLKQALTASSADQRLLVITVNSGQAKTKAKTDLIPVRKAFNHEGIYGAIHFDQLSSDAETWQNLVKGNKTTSGHFILQAEPYGRFGTVLKELPLTASSAQLVTAITAANKKYAATEKRKDFTAHVRHGLNEGIKADTNITREAVRDGKRD